MALPKPILRVLGFFRCILLSHQPNRRRVRKLSNGNHLGYCQHCGVQIKRTGHNQWSRDYKNREKDWRGKPVYEESQSVDS